MKIPVLLAQFPVSLSISANLQTILSLMERAETGDILLLPEGAISGYAPDLSFLGDLDLGELNQPWMNCDSRPKGRESTCGLGLVCTKMGNGSTQPLVSHPPGALTSTVKSTLPTTNEPF